MLRIRGAELKRSFKRAPYALSPRNAKSRTEPSASSAMSPGNLYRFYSGKKAIGLAVYAAFLSHLRETAEAAVAPLAEGAEAHIRALLMSEVIGWARKLMREPKFTQLAEPVEPLPDRVPVPEPLRQRPPGDVVDSEVMKGFEK
jgi:AcrR family transcriptional regulator